MPDLSGVSTGFKQKSMSHARPSQQSMSQVPKNPGRPSGASDGMPRNRQSKQKGFIPPWAINLMGTGQPSANIQMQGMIQQPQMQPLQQPQMGQQPPQGQQSVVPQWQQALQKRIAMMKTLGR